MKNRHFKVGTGVGKMTSTGRKHVQRAASIVKTHLLQSAYDSGKLAAVFEVIETLPEEFKSSKWTEERFLSALRRAGVDNARELKRDLNVKPNEALSKEKARAIISAGDDGVVRHLFDAGILERVLFENPVYEQRSIKHATPHELEEGRRDAEELWIHGEHGLWRVRRFMHRRSPQHHWKRRDLSLFGKPLDTENDSGLLYHAIFDRIENKANINVKNILEEVIYDMIRESGDRGTSVLNFITNLVLFLANVSMMLESIGAKEKEIRRMLWEVLVSGKWANMMAEGDDGAQAFKKAFVEMFGSVAQFGKLWCSGYAEFGFQIEPQGPAGELSFEKCLEPTTERMEFCSKIFVCVGKDTYYFPKPSKLSSSMSVSFFCDCTRHDAGCTTAVSMIVKSSHKPCCSSWTVESFLLIIKKNALRLICLDLAKNRAWNTDPSWNFKS